MTRATDRAIDIIVKSGPHRGATETMPAGRCRIGSTVESELVLVDADMSPVHCSLEFDGRRLSVAAVAGETVLGRNRRLRPNERRFVHVPASLRVGGTELGIRWHRARGVRRGHWQSAGAGLALASASLALLYGADRFGGTDFVAALLPTSTGKPTSTVDVARQAPPMPSRDGGTAAEAIGKDAGAVATALRDRLAQFALGDQIDVALADGVIVAKGNVDPSTADRWLAVQTWFDAQFGQRVLLVRQVQIVQQLGAPRLSVRAVWTGTVPYVVTGDGEKYGEGAVLDGGWIIDRIEQKQIMLRHGKRTLALNL